MLNDWISTFEAMDVCPWPGPRPLRSEETLVGREQDRERFYVDISGSSFVVLSGASGVGKSSFLKAGLIPDLVAEGYTVAICDDYSGGDLGNWKRAVASLGAKIRNDLLATDSLPGVDLPSDGTIFRLLDQRLGGKAVVVFDQFEELIRHAPAQKEAAFEAILAIHKTFRLKILISLRDEYLHELRSIERQVKGFSYSKFMLEDLGKDKALDIVTSINQPDAMKTISVDAARYVADAWVAAASDTTEHSILDPFGRIGLLHLQAFLYYLDSGTISQKVIEESDVEDAIRRLPTSEPSKAEVFKQALVKAVDIKLERSRHAAVEAGVDPFLIEGAAGLLARSVRHLSSAGYKLVREGADLFRATMGSDLDVLLRGTQRRRPAGKSGHLQEWYDHPERSPVEPAHVEALVRSMAVAITERADGELDIITADRTDFARAVDERTADDPDKATDWLERVSVVAAPWVADPEEVTCGPLSGLPAAAVIVEEARRFVLALAWLSRSNLARLSTPAEGETMVSLIHDGFGRALQHWGENRISSSDVALHAFTATPGPSFVWKRPGSRGMGIIGSPERPRVIANLRWRGGFVMSDFEHVVLTNCDLRGTLFKDCTFTGVTMINCLLDGTIFSECTFDGTPAPVSGVQQLDAAPTFVVDTDDEYVEYIAKYREMNEEHDGDLFSSLPGAPAIPSRPGIGSTLRYEPANAGLVFYGGRLSTLIVRACNFDDGGISIRYSAGSGLELVELSHLDIDIVGSALRHIAVTAPASVGRDGAPQIDMHAVSSFLGQAWVGANVRGRMRLADCIVAQVWNEGDVDLRLIDGSIGVHMPGAGVDEDSVMVDPDVSSTSNAFGTDGRAGLISRALDYRRNPALEQVLIESSDTDEDL